jgi:small subunit ribosomal protein S3
VGQKTHPYGFRLGYNKTWHSRWYADKGYADTLIEDVTLRSKLKKRLAHAGVSEIDIERAAERLRITIHTSRPGIIIGRKGAEVDKLREKSRQQRGREGHVNILEVHRPEHDAQLVAESIAGQLERRVSCRGARW